MKKLSTAVLLLTMLVSLSSCQAIADIFGAGVKVGVILVIVVIALVIFVIARIFGRR